MVDMYEIEDFYKELGYTPPKNNWKYGLLVFITIIIPIMVLIGISCVASLPIFIKEKLSKLM